MFRNLKYVRKKEKRKRKIEKKKGKKKQEEKGKISNWKKEKRNKKQKTENRKMKILVEGSSQKSVGTKTENELSRRSGHAGGTCYDAIGRPMGTLKVSLVGNP